MFLLVAFGVCPFGWSFVNGGCFRVTQEVNSRSLFMNDNGKPKGAIKNNGPPKNDKKAAPPKVDKKSRPPKVDKKSGLPKNPSLPAKGNKKDEKSKPI